MSNPYNVVEIERWEHHTPFDKHGFALSHQEIYVEDDGKREPVDLEVEDNPWDFATHARQITNPYGILEWCVGTSDDFWCFDYAQLYDGRIVLDATINSETGSFIMGGGYKVLPATTDPLAVAREAMEMVGQALEWCADNDVEHDREGWNQDPYYFYRAVCRGLGIEPYASMPQYSEAAGLAGDACRFGEVPSYPEPSQKRFLIRNPQTNLYWSNDDGWVDRDSATLFTHAEKEAVDLPMEGVWVDLGPPVAAENS